MGFVREDMVVVECGPRGWGGAPGIIVLRTVASVNYLVLRLHVGLDTRRIMPIGLYHPYMFWIVL